MVSGNRNLTIGFLLATGGMLSATSSGSGSTIGCGDPDDEEGCPVLDSVSSLALS